MLNELRLLTNSSSETVYVNSGTGVPNDDNAKVAVPEENLYHKGILGKWAKEHCLTAPISFNRDSHK